MGCAVFGSGLGKDFGFLGKSAYVFASIANKKDKIKTTALPQYLLQTVRKCHISNKTEINKVI